MFGLLFAMALAGGMTLPWALGRLAGARGFRGAWLLPAAGFLAILAVGTAIIGPRSSPRARGPRPAGSA